MEHEIDREIRDWEKTTEHEIDREIRDWEQVNREIRDWEKTMEHEIVKWGGALKQFKLCLRKI